MTERQGIIPFSTNLATSGPRCRTCAGARYSTRAGALGVVRECPFAILASSIDPNGPETPFARRDDIHETPTEGCHRPSASQPDHLHLQYHQTRTGHPASIFFSLPCRVVQRIRGRDLFDKRHTTYLAFGTLPGSLDTIATFDNIRLQAYRTRPAMQLREQTIGITENRPEFISAPEGRSGSTTILAHGLRLGQRLVCQRSRHCRNRIQEAKKNGEIYRAEPEETKSTS